MDTKEVPFEQFKELMIQDFIKHTQAEPPSEDPGVTCYRLTKVQPPSSTEPEEKHYFFGLKHVAQGERSSN